MPVATLSNLKDRLSGGNTTMIRSAGPSFAPAPRPNPSLLQAERFSMSVILLKIKNQTGEAIFLAMLLGRFIR